jgi:uncharacterized protein YecE (DUF72 family)
MRLSAIFRADNSSLSDFVYVRGHGPEGRYKSHYSTDALARWAKRIRSWKSQGCDVFVFFDNDQKSAAPIDAVKLKQMLQGMSAVPLLGTV